MQKITLTTIALMIFIMTGTMANGYGSTLPEEETLNFDNISNSPFEMGLNEGGFNWDGFGVVNTEKVDGYRNNSVSGDYVAFNWNSSSSSVSGQWFYLAGFYVAAVFDEVLNFTVRGYGENGIVSRSYEINNHTPTWIDPGLWINRAEFITSSVNTPSLLGDLSSGGSFFSIDNFSYSMTNPIPNPEPTTLLLLGMGLLSISFISRKNLLDTKTIT